MVWRIIVIHPLRRSGWSLKKALLEIFLCDSRILREMVQVILNSSGNQVALIKNNKGGMDPVRFEVKENNLTFILR